MTTRTSWNPSDNLRTTPVILDPDYLALTVLVTFVYQAVFYFIAAVCKFDKVTDFSYGTNFIALAVLTFFLNQTYYIRQIINTGLVIIWGIRLGGFLLVRIIAIGQDKRFDGMREKPLQFLRFWIFQFLSILVIYLPMCFVNAEYFDIALQWNDYFGWGLWLIGFLIETIADQQKFNYRQDPNNKDHWCDAGIWSWSRHPNYFGEMLCWIGIWASAASILVGGEWATVVSPLYIINILLFLSGLNRLERSADDKYWNNAEYLRYKKSTSPIILCPPPLYRALAKALKCIVCCEFPLYTLSPEEKKKLEDKKHREERRLEEGRSSENS
eukprot:TRINITY_DN14433_c0_g1_i1.p1 TRINITY_DN14433_c0_g1~~TRINITY_DN14433_c0_g1_i1.p1  ORF type:complete len:334 (-),score=71.14 TRINITY_DN14433_c0_g1_i1:140-1120(-)